MRKQFARASLLASSLLLSTHFSTALAGDLQCNVAVIGAGAGGLHTAYQLSKRPKSDPNSDVCVFEKEDRVGGRIYDIALNPEQPDKVFGMGALRVMETQDYLFKLADELGIELVQAPFTDDLIQARGETAFTSDDINNQAYPLVTKQYINGGGFDTEGALYDQLRHGPNRANAKNYPDFRSYVRDTVGTQGYQFLADVFRFRGDFQENLSASGYLDYLDEEWDVCCTPSYPVGGMSQFVKRMAAKAAANGARIYLSEPVSSISKAGGAAPYTLITTKNTVHARRVVIAVPKEGLQYINGNIANAIKQQQQFKDLTGIKVVTIAQRWPNAWWQQSGYAGRDIHRAWSTETCVNFVEIPTAPYAADQLVTRTVYTDDPNCVKFWENTTRLGKDQVEAEIQRGLAVMFPNANIPQPLNTVVQVWPAAWY
ncbi:MAG TPA: FAD-dependent oxidoreductase, partial [Pseudomonadales bacterium]|nr:FAD-dependent oxidoreductase [Pseudomonadales bacterium]